MSFRKKYIEWEVPASKVQLGVAVGFEIELSQNANFHPITYRMTTFEEQSELYYGRFYYSLDDGDTWASYPSGEAGKIFNQPFRMKLELNANNTGHIVAFADGYVYKISANGQTINESWNININDIIDSGYDEKDGVLYLTGLKTLYRVQIDPVISAYDNSININGDGAIGVVVDDVRETFWQINHSNVCLKNLYGETIYCTDLGYDIDVEYSSSSSSSSS